MITNFRDMGLIQGHSQGSTKFTKNVVTFQGFIYKGSGRQFRMRVFQKKSC